MRLLRFVVAALVALIAAPFAASFARAAAQPATAQPATAQVAGAQVAGAQAAGVATTPGAVVVPAGTVRDGDLVLLSGDVDVRGQVRGDVVSVLGDVTVGPRGRVTGSARSLFGTARTSGGRVDGLVRSGLGGRAEFAEPRPRSLASAAGVTVAWFLVLLVLGIGLLAGASTQLDAVAGALEDAPGRAVAAGVAGQLVLAPGLVILVAALAVTVIGALAVPLAVVLYVLAAAGLLTLGFLAAAFVLGRWVGGGGGRRESGRPRAAAVRGASLRALGVGLALFFAVWMAAALLGAVPAAGLFVRAAALAATWLAVTAGFGAALLSRGGRRAGRPVAAAATAGGDARGSVPVWQTPTPVSGVVSARRPRAATPTAGAGVE